MFWQKIHLTLLWILIQIFGKHVDNQVRDTIDEVLSKPVEKSNDDYFVEVKLKDDIPFAYSARRFARYLEIDRIIEDLRARDIIQDSMSSYCSRIILVREKK